MKRSIIWGLVLVLAGVYMVVSHMGLVPELPMFTILFTILFVYTAVEGVIHRSFTGIFVSVALLAWVYEDYLRIEEICPWPVVPAGILVGIGLDMIFKNFRRKHNNSFGNVNIHQKGHAPYVENIPDGSFVNVANSFGAISKYVNSGAFTDAKVKNSFGSCNVYFNHAIMKTSQANVKVENSFGEINLYFPASWRIQIQQSCAFGDVQFHGVASNNPEAPCVFITAESNFGSINIYSE